jgi:hypothetical protein
MYEVSSGVCHGSRVSRGAIRIRRTNRYNPRFQLQVPSLVSRQPQMEPPPLLVVVVVLLLLLLVVVVLVVVLVVLVVLLLLGCSSSGAAGAGAGAGIVIR